MIREIKDLPSHVIGFVLKGKITGADYETNIFPVLKKAAKSKKKIRIVVKFSDSFKKFNFKAMVDDASLGMKYYSQWERIAIVSNHNWLNHTIKAFAFLVPSHLKLFTSDEFDNAVKWVSKK